MSRTAGGADGAPAALTGAGKSGYASSRALRRALEVRVGPVPGRVWRRLALPHAWAPFTSAELNDLVKWWQEEFAPPPDRARERPPLPEPAQLPRGPRDVE